MKKKTLKAIFTKEKIRRRLENAYVMLDEAAYYMEVRGEDAKRAHAAAGIARDLLERYSTQTRRRLNEADRYRNARRANAEYVIRDASMTTAEAEAARAKLALVDVNYTQGFTWPWRYRGQESRYGNYGYSWARKYMSQAYQQVFDELPPCAALDNKETDNE